MRAVFLSLAFAASIMPLAGAQAEGRTSVIITPRYLSAGTVVSPYEYRASVPDSDARFQPVTNGLTGKFSDWQQDPFYVPKPQSSRVDLGPLSSKGRYNF